MSQKLQEMVELERLAEYFQQEPKVMGEWKNYSMSLSYPWQGVFSLEKLEVFVNAMPLKL